MKVVATVPDKNKSYWRAVRQCACCLSIVSIDVRDLMIHDVPSRPVVFMCGACDNPNEITVPMVIRRNIKLKLEGKWAVQYLAKIPQ